MKKTIAVLLILLAVPLICHAQSIVADFVWNHESDKTVYWILTDANSQKYKGHCDMALDANVTNYLEEHMDEWLAEIYDMNTNPNIPDWVDTHLGKYTQTVNQIENMDTWPECQAIIKKIVKYLQKASLVVND